MLLHTALVPILLVAAPVSQERPGLHGTFRDREDAEPIASVLVEAVGTPHRAWSDSLGAYELPLLKPGSQRIRISRLGYEGLEVEVVLPPQGVMRLDATLDPRPVHLSGVRLESGREGRGTPGIARGMIHDAELGSRTFSVEERQLAPPGGEPDALWAVAGAPEVALRPDLPTALHVRGGSADQNLVLLDGIPVLSPHHSGGVLSAVPPDAVAEVTLHAGVLPARWGGALSSALEVRTREVPRQGMASRGGVAMRSLRGTFAHALPVGSGGVLLAGRRSHRPGSPGGEDDQDGRFGDLLAKATVDLPGGGIDVVSFATEDRLAFASALDPEDAGGVTAQPGPRAVESPNRFQWSGRTFGVTWRRAWEGGARGELSAWHSGLDATVDWAAESGGVRLRSARSQVGIGARMGGPLAGGSASGGLSLERLRASYDTRGLAGSSPSPAGDSLLALDSSTLLLSAFLEEVWHPAERWSFRLGLRGQAAPALGLLPEPRLSLSFAPSPEVLVSAGYARTRQFVQSLRNEESILDAVSGIDLPVVVGAPGVPAARSDQLTAAVAAALGAATRLELEVYARWLDGLLLVAPTSSQPFALSGYETGSGRAAGAALLLEHRGPRLAARIAYGLATAVRRAGGVDYHTSFERPRSLSAGVDWRAGGRTLMTAGILAAAGSPTTPVAGAFDWEQFEPLGGGGELEGSPQRNVGPLNGERLPAYLRLDLGVRQEWRAGWLREGAALAARVDVLNILDRQNVVAYAVDPDTGARRPLTLLGRSLALGLEWRY